MIEGGFRGSNKRHERATAAAKSIEHMFDDLPQEKQLSILLAVETVVSELLGFQNEVVRAWQGQNYKHAARGLKELYQDPAIQKEITKFVEKHGGNTSELPW